MRLYTLGTGFVALIAGSAAADEVVPVRQWTGLNASEKEARDAVIQTANDWKAAWQAAHARQKPVPDVPAVDFDKHSVLAMYAGAKNSGGYRVVIDRIDKGADGLAVKYLVRTPNPKKVYPASITSPFLFVLVPKAPAKVSFTKTFKPED